MRHLDAMAVAELDRGDEAARAYFAQHLGAPCEECEAFLAGTEVLDGAADSALIGGEDRDAALDEVGFRRISARIEAAESGGRVRTSGSRAESGSLTTGGALSRGERGGRRSRVVVLAGSIAAALIAFVGIWRVATIAPTQTQTKTGAGFDNIKSVSAALTLELQAARRDERGGLTRVDAHTSVPAAGELVLRYYATEKGGAQLLRRARDGGLEALGTFELEPGAHPLTLESGDVAALPLDGEAGELTVYLVGAPGGAPPLDRAKAAVDNPRSAGLSITELSLTVVPNR